MTRTLVALLLAVALLASAARAQMPIDVPGTPPLTGALWLPEGNARGPLVLLLHGAGGGFTDHAPLAQALAQGGIAAVAFTQEADRSAPHAFARMAGRAREATRALDHVLAIQHARVDPARVGVFGYSAGGTAAMLLVGGRADPARWVALCAEHPEERLCQSPFGRAALDAAAGLGPFDAPDPRVRAALLAAPALGFLFAPDGFAAVAPGTRLRVWRAGADTVLREPHHAEAIAPLLPGRPVPVVVPQAGHWVFMPPCDAERRVALPYLCADPPGLDRVAFLRHFAADAVAFFTAALAERSLRPDAER
jgi:predicted dienelactone hydrolase